MKNLITNFLRDHKQAVLTTMLAVLIVVAAHFLGGFVAIAALGVTGTVALEDLRKNKNVSAIGFGLERIDEIVRADAAAAEAALTARLAELAETSSDVQRIYGVSAKIRGVPADEFGRAPTRKKIGGETVGFPLSMLKYAVGWTSKFLEIASPAEIAEQFLRVRTGYFADVNAKITQALFDKDNYDHVDPQPDGTDGVTIKVKRLINADGSVIPDGPNGETFDGTSHTHYLARAGALANSDIDGLINHIIEHGHTRDIRIIVHVNDEDVLAGLASTKFKALTAPGLVPTSGDTVLAVDPNADLGNRQIGIWGNRSIPVWVKPWGIDDYIFAYAAGETEKVLVRRQRQQASLQGLRLIERQAGYPLLSDNWEAEFGFGVWSRTMGAILYTGGTSWTDPVLSAL